MLNKQLESIIKKSILASGIMLGISLTSQEAAAQNNTQVLAQSSNKIESNIGPQKTVSMDEDSIHPYKTPGMASIVSPANNSNVSSPAQYELIPASGATEYEVIIAKDSLFNDIVKDTVVDNLSPAIPLSDATYYSKVFGKNSAGNGPETGVVTFSVVSTGLNTATEKNYGIYPNPASKYLNIKFDNDKHVKSGIGVELFSLDGRLQEHTTVYDIDNRIDISNLKTGLYIVLVTENGKTSAGKVSVK